MLQIRQIRVSSIQRKLANVGLEVTPNEIWEQAISDSGNQPIWALEMLESWDSDPHCFANLANFLAHRAGRETPVFVYGQIVAPVGSDRMFFVVLFFCLSLLFWSFLCN